jgi:hypothetical protein
MLLAWHNKVLDRLFSMFCVDLKTVHLISRNIGKAAKLESVIQMVDYQIPISKAKKTI